MKYLHEDGEYENFGCHLDVGPVVGVRSDNGAVLVVGEVGAGLVARGTWFGFVAWTAQEAGSASQAGRGMGLGRAGISWGWVHPSSWSGTLRNISVLVMAIVMLMTIYGTDMAIVSFNSFTMHFSCILYWEMANYISYMWPALITTGRNPIFFLLYSDFIATTKKAI